MFSLNELLKSHVTVEAETLAIKDLLLSVEDHRLSHVLIDIGNWRDAQFAMVETSAISDFNPRQDRLTLTMRQDEIEAAPVLSEGSPLISKALPPVVIGPFGGTLSPLMIAAAISTEPTPSTEGAESIASRHDFLSDMIGMDVFGKDGQLGTLHDLYIADSGYNLLAMVISDPKASPGQHRMVPIEKMRHMADQETHLVLDVTSHDLRDAPSFRAATDTADSYLDQLRRHYG